MLSVADYRQSTWTDTTTASEVTAAITWLAGDLVVVLGSTESDVRTLNLPTATALVFSLVTSFTVASACRLYVWQALAGAGGSSAITSTTDGGDGVRGLSAFVFRDHGGIGNTSISSGTQTTSVRSLTRARADSHVIAAVADYTANADVTVTLVPASGGTQRVAATRATNATFFVADWIAQGAPGATDYGVADFAGVTNNVLVVVEILVAPRGSDRLMVPTQRMI